MAGTDRNTSALLDQATKLLEAHPVRGVRAADLAGVLAACTLRRMSTGDVLCSEGEPGDSMYFLLDGSIQVSRTDPHGRVRSLALIQSPAVVGHMALIDHSPRSATCAAEGRTAVASLDRRSWNRILHEQSERGTALRRVLCASLTRQLVGANLSIRKLVDAPPPPRSRSMTRSMDRGHKSALDPGRKVARHDVVEDFDASESDLLRVAGVLDGWRIDHSSLRAVEKVQHVFDEDQRRNRKR
jgi:CRP-like cAMP-binding protein